MVAPCTRWGWTPRAECPLGACRAAFCEGQLGLGSTVLRAGAGQGALALLPRNRALARAPLPRAALALSLAGQRALALAGVALAGGALALTVALSRQAAEATAAVRRSRPSLLTVRWLGLSGMCSMCAPSKKPRRCRRGFPFAEAAGSSVPFSVPEPTSRS